MTQIGFYRDKKLYYHKMKVVRLRLHSDSVILLKKNMSLAEKESSIGTWQNVHCNDWMERITGIYR